MNRRTLIASWDNVKHFRQSETEGGGWNASPEGLVRIEEIQKGKARFTYHNPLTKVCGLNMLFMEGNPIRVEGMAAYFKGLSIYWNGNEYKTMRARSPLQN